MTPTLQPIRMPDPSQRIGEVDFRRSSELLMECHWRTVHFLGDLYPMAARTTIGDLDATLRPVLATGQNYFYQAVNAEMHERR